MQEEPSTRGGFEQQEQEQEKEDFAFISRKKSLGKIFVVKINIHIGEEDRGRKGEVVQEEDEEDSLVLGNNVLHDKTIEIIDQ